MSDRLDQLVRDAQAERWQLPMRDEANRPFVPGQVWVEVTPGDFRLFPVVNDPSDSPYNQALRRLALEVAAERMRSRGHW